MKTIPLKMSLYATLTWNIFLLILLEADKNFAVVFDKLFYLNYIFFKKIIESISVQNVFLIQNYEKGFSGNMGRKKNFEGLGRLTKNLMKRTWREKVFICNGGKPYKFNIFGFGRSPPSFCSVSSADIPKIWSAFSELTLM